jgi:hypothetical protein
MPTLRQWRRWTAAAEAAATAFMASRKRDRSARRGAARRGVGGRRVLSAMAGLPGRPAAQRQDRRFTSGPDPLLNSEVDNGYD